MGGGEKFKDGARSVASRRQGSVLSLNRCCEVAESGQNEVWVAAGPAWLGHDCGERTATGSAWAKVNAARASTLVRQYAPQACLYGRTRREELGFVGQSSEQAPGDSRDGRNSRRRRVVFAAAAAAAAAPSPPSAPLGTASSTPLEHVRPAGEQTRDGMEASDPSSRGVPITHTLRSHAVSARLVTCPSPGPRAT